MEKPVGCYSSRDAGISCWRADIRIKAEQGAGLKRIPEISNCSQNRGCERLVGVGRRRWFQGQKENKNRLGEQCWPG